MPESQPALAFPGSGRPLWALPQQHAGRLQEVPSCLARRQPKGSSRAEGPDQSELLSKWPFLLREHPAQSLCCTFLVFSGDTLGPGFPRLSSSPYRKGDSPGSGYTALVHGSHSKGHPFQPLPSALGLPFYQQTNPSQMTVGVA